VVVDDLISLDLSVIFFKDVGEGDDGGGEMGVGDLFDCLDVGVDCELESELSVK
jgi:hypothetical protein